MMQDLRKLENLFKIWYDSEEYSLDEICCKMYDLDNNVGRYHSSRMLEAKNEIEKYAIAHNWFMDLKANIKGKITNNLEILDEINHLIKLKM